MSDGFASLPDGQTEVETETRTTWPTNISTVLCILGQTFTFQLSPHIRQLWVHHNCYKSPIFVNICLNQFFTSVAKLSLDSGFPSDGYPIDEVVYKWDSPAVSLSSFTISQFDLLTFNYRNGTVQFKRGITCRLALGCDDYAGRQQLDAASQFQLAATRRLLPNPDLRSLFTHCRPFVGLILDK